MTSSRQRVLFLCIHNSARSQMAEELFRRRCGDRFDVESAGLEPGVLNPLAVEVLMEEGIDISGKETVNVQDVVDSGRSFDYVITVCAQASAERCPVFPGGGTRIHWDFPDPSRFEGEWEERVEQTRTVREQIRRAIEQFCAEHCAVDAGQE